MILKSKFSGFPPLAIGFWSLQLCKMLYALSKFSSVNGNPHTLDITYCSLCGSGVETINLSNSPSPCTTSALVNPASWQPPQWLLPPAAPVQCDAVNNRLKNVQNNCPNAGSNALSSRVLK